MTAARTARERVREELTTQIKQIARSQLAEVGPSALSLRAVARELGMVSSAIYRYFPSRDALLTALIIDSYDALGETSEQAAALPGTAAERWLRVCRAVRSWALAHPHEWALVYGSPVPGYAAPTDTVPAAMRLTAAMAAVVRDGVSSGELRPPTRPLPTPSVMTAEATAFAGGEPTAPYDDLVERALVLVIGLVGAISYELFGHLVGATTDNSRYFDRAMALLAEPVGMTLPIG